MKWRPLHEIEDSWYKEKAEAQLISEGRKSGDAGFILTLNLRIRNLKEQVRQLYATPLTVEMFTDWFEGWKEDWDNQELESATPYTDYKHWIQIGDGYVSGGRIVGKTYFNDICEPYYKGDFTVADLINFTYKSFPLYVGSAEQIQILKG
jgi:hypothetical protein